MTVFSASGPDFFKKLQELEDKKHLHKNVTVYTARNAANELWHLCEKSG
jgi:hypothetical protein